jgi:hypothetical protein
VINTHSQSWDCDSEDKSAHAVQSLFDGLYLVHLNDGTLTRIVAPPQRLSAIDLTLCTEGLALGDYERTVLEMFTYFQSLNVPTNLSIPIFDLSGRISWSVYPNAMLNHSG